MGTCTAAEWDACMTAAPPETPPRKYKTLAEREAAARARVVAPPVDFSYVPPKQYDIHDDLQTWALWVTMRGKSDGNAAPMFRRFRSDTWDRRAYGSATATVHEWPRAVEIQKVVGNPSFPAKHRDALNWYYIQKCRNAIFNARALAVSLQGLADLVIDARTMLINRGL